MSHVWSYWRCARMPIFFYMKKLLKKLFARSSDNFSCHIREFDLRNREVVIYCYGVRIITIKADISDMINDPNIIVNLPSDQACWLGYYYGKLCVYTSTTKYPKDKGGNFLLRFTRGRFKVHTYTKEGILTYVDVKTNKSYREKPIAIARNQFIIAQFDSSQACYIGMLAGLAVAKYGEQLIEENKQPILTLIK